MNLVKSGKYAEALKAVAGGVSSETLDRIITLYARSGALEKAVRISEFRKDHPYLRTNEVDMLIDAYIERGSINFACTLLEYGASERKVHFLVDSYVTHGWFMEASIAARYRENGHLTTDELDQILLASVKENDTLYDAQWAAVSGASRTAIRKLEAAFHRKSEVCAV